MDCSSPQSSTGAASSPVPGAQPGAAPTAAQPQVHPSLPEGAAAAAAAAQNVPPGVALLGSGGWTFFPGLDSPGGDIGQAPGLAAGGQPETASAGGTAQGANGAPAPGSLAAALAIAQSRLTMSGPGAGAPMPCTCAAAVPGAGAPGLDAAAVAAAALAPPGTQCPVCGGVRGLAHPPGITLLSGGAAPPHAAGAPGPEAGSAGAAGAPGAPNTAVISASSSHFGDHWWLSAPIVAFNTNGAAHLQASIISSQHCIS